MDKLNKHIQYLENKTLEQAAVLQLYTDANWTAYTKHPTQLMQALENSLYVLSAWDKETLVGLIRVIGDGHTIIYIQDILILKTYQRKGIGKTLMEKVLTKFDHVRQKVLLTDDLAKTKQFYQSVGFKPCSEYNTIAFLKTT